MARAQALCADCQQPIVKTASDGPWFHVDDSKPKHPARPIRPEQEIIAEYEAAKLRKTQEQLAAIKAVPWLDQLYRDLGWRIQEFDRNRIQLYIEQGATVGEMRATAPEEETQRANFMQSQSTLQDRYESYNVAIRNISDAIAKLQHARLALSPYVADPYR